MQACTDMCASTEWKTHKLVSSTFTHLQLFEEKHSLLVLLCKAGIFYSMMYRVINKSLSTFPREHCSSLEYTQVFTEMPATAQILPVELALSEPLNFRGENPLRRPGKGFCVISQPTDASLICFFSTFILFSLSILCKLNQP